MTEIQAIKIDKINVSGHPKIAETSHVCGGKLIYREGHYSTSWNGISLRIGSIWAYFCDTYQISPILLPEVNAELESQIDKALGRSPRQSIL